MSFFIEKTKKMHKDLKIYTIQRNNE